MCNDQYQLNEDELIEDIKCDYNFMLEENIGPAGVSIQEFNRQKEVIDTALYNMRQKRFLMQWRDLPYTQDEIVKDINKTAEKIRDKFEYFVVFGIGGSALGALMLQNAICHLKYNELPREKRKGPKFFVEDNIDPEGIMALLDVIEPEKTCFNIITKSGSTSETMSQMLIITDILKDRLGAKASSHIIATTDENSGNLRRIALAEGYEMFYVPQGVGGRFSVLSPVGLLPAAVLGIDIAKLLEGAAHMESICDEYDIFKNKAYMGAALQVFAMQSGKNISVMMPYAASLNYFAHWYAQLWAESLGKKDDIKGMPLYSGQTPVKALGVTDQHSQIQLYTEGPFDKTLTFLCVDKYRDTVEIPLLYELIKDVSFLGDKTLNELIKAEEYGTMYAIYKAKRPFMKVSMPEVNEHTLGQLIQMYELMTAFAGELLEINTFNQPGVELGKDVTYALMGKPGFEQMLEELRQMPQGDPKFIL